MPLSLPGLEDASEFAGPKTPLRTAVDATLEELEAKQLLRPQHAALAAAARVMADAVEVGTATGKASAAAMAMAQLLAVLDRLPQPAELPEGKTWEQRVEELLREQEHTAS